MKFYNRRTLESPVLTIFQHDFNGQVISADYNESVDMNNSGKEKLQ